MPSDILGTEVIEEDRATGKRVIRFIRGPIFANIILADEINRTPPKTQAALLEAMQEYQVTVNGVRYALERPLFVLATQNPIEQEGTYPLPEAQLDRFMFNVVIDYPTAEEERRILVDDDRRRPSRRSQSVATGDEIERLHAVVRDVPAATNVDRLRAAARARDAAADRPRTAPGVRPQVGALGRRSARRPGAAARRQGARAARRPQRRRARRRRARSRCRCCAIACCVNFQAEADGIDADEIVRRLLDAVALTRPIAASHVRRLDPRCSARSRDLELVARVIVDGTVSGLHRSPFHGYSAEFSQYRHYRPGDDLKYVDWKLFARTDRLYTKQFRETTNLLCADRGRRQRVDGVRGARTGVTKLALRAAARRRARASVSRQGDAVGLVTYADALRELSAEPRRAGCTCARCWSR